jgi:plasmid stabilization system protein ParE
MKIVWSPLSVDRLKEIAEYISKKDITASQKMVARIFTKVETLSEFPKRGRKVPEIKREEIREVFLGEYRIIYRVETNEVIVLTIRNFKQLLSDEDIV